MWGCCSLFAGGDEMFLTRVLEALRRRCVASFRSKQTYKAEPLERRTLLSGSLAGAVPIGWYEGSHVYYGAVNAVTQPIQYHSFFMESAGTLSIRLLGMQSNADLFLVKDFNYNQSIDAGEVLATSTNPGTQSDSIFKSLAGGTYYIGVASRGGNTSYTLALSADYAGNTLATARNMGTLAGSVSAGDFIGQIDPNDYYRFAINSPEKFAATLGTLSTNVGLQLISDSNHDGIVESSDILASANLGTAGGSIRKTLAPGVYYVRVYETANSSNYHLTISATTPAANLHIVFNYQFDSSGFFAAHPDAVARLNQAAAMFSVFSDQLTALVPGSGNTWQEQFDNPATGRLVSVNNPVVAANTVVIYVGASSGLQALELGEGAPGGWTATGSETWLQDVEARGQSGALMGHPTDFGPWGGSISFSRFTNWNFSANPPAASAEDFLSVAIHEIAHVLGFGTSDSWNTYSSTGTFTGPHGDLANGGKPVPLSADSAHWADGSKSAVGSLWQACMMDPYLPAGQRRTLTQLDFAGLEDVGWQFG